MTKRRKKKPTSGYRPTPSGDGATKATATTTSGKSSTKVTSTTTSGSGIPGFLGFLSRPSGEGPWPSIPRALGRGFVTVGSSPVLLGSGFLLVLLMWLGLVLLGLEGPPGRLVNLLALPPISTYFDALNGVTIYGFGPQGFLAASAFLLIRAVILALVTGLVVQTLLGEGTIADGLRRGIRAIPVTATVSLLTLSLMILGSVLLPLLGPGLGFLASVLTLVAALFLFVFAPIAATWETDRTLSDVIRRAARAALMPGSRHLLMCLLYIFLTLPILVALAPGGALLGVNPTLATWIYALVCTFVHLAFLAAFAYRFLAIVDEIPDQPIKLRRR